MTREDRDKWLARADTRHERADEDPTHIITEFCDDSDGLAEFALNYQQSENGDSMWFADVRWNGKPTSTEETDLGSHTYPVIAVYLAIERCLFRVRPPEGGTER